MTLRTFRHFACVLLVAALAGAPLTTAVAAQAIDRQPDDLNQPDAMQGDDDGLAGQGAVEQATAGQGAGQQGTRGATAQLAAPSTPVTTFRADDLTPTTRTRTQQRGNDGILPPEPRSDRRIVASEFETYASEIADQPLLRFGSTLLVPNARGFTAPAATAVPPDYRLNPGDELVIGLTGAVQANELRPVIDPEGRIFIPHVGAVTVGGLRYADVSRAISAQVARQYRDFRVAVGIGQLHGITVYVTGFAATPGSYTVSSLSTLVDGVLAAGGPTSGGSFRTIELRRAGRTVSVFDLYDLLLRGDKTADVTLQNGDVIFIAPAGPQVAAIGSVNNAAIFEAKAGETLADVLRDAGGINTVADDTRVLLLDSFQQRSRGWNELAIGTLGGQPARRGEILRVLSGIGLAVPTRSQAVLVTVSGEVARPGRYFLQPGVTLAAALAEAGGLTPQAYPFASVVTRESVRLQQRTSFKRALADLEFSLTAQPLVSALPTVSQDPARLQAIRSLVAQLGTRKPEGRLVLDVTPSSATLPGDLVLENNDTVLVPPVPVTVGVFGAVVSPSSFILAPGGTVATYLARAGGAQRVGDARRTVVIRANGAVIATTHGHRVLSAPVLPGDLIFVPIAAGRGEFWIKLRDLSSTLFTGALSGAAVASLAR